jgi:hypothetical protein
MVREVDLLDDGLNGVAELAHYVETGLQPVHTVQHTLQHNCRVSNAYNWVTLSSVHCK